MRSDIIRVKAADMKRMTEEVELGYLLFCFELVSFKSNGDALLRANRLATRELTRKGVSYSLNDIEDD
jgi:hypothetical protein